MYYSMKIMSCTNQPKVRNGVPQEVGCQQFFAISGYIMSTVC